MGAYAFIPPRFGPGCGGAETLVAELAEQLARRGDKVEIWTTCARDNRSWDNELAQGLSEERGLKVWRFPVEPRDLDIWVRHQVAISEGLRISPDDQLEWMEQGVNSAALYDHIERHAHEFDALFFAPYLFGTTFFGSQICLERSYLIPCLHDENYAYLEIMRVMFRRARGVLFNSEAEMALAHRLYGALSGGEVGMGFGFSSAVPEKPYFAENFPYLLYLGRKETGKGAQLLIDHFIKLKAGCPELESLKLVICGGGDFSDLHRPQALGREDLIDLKHVSEEEKARLLKHALFLAQPSVNESFSIVLMEAWLAHTPVLVNAMCEVTRQHVIDSGGGAYFGSYADFEAVTKELFSNAELRARLAKGGEAYVRRRYNWPSVLARFDAVLSGSAGAAA